MLLWFIEKNCISLLIINHNNHYVLVVFLYFLSYIYIIVIIISVGFGGLIIWFVKNSSH